MRSYVFIEIANNILLGNDPIIKHKKEGHCDKIIKNRGEKAQLQQKFCEKVKIKGTCGRELKLSVLCPLKPCKGTRKLNINVKTINTHS